MKRKPKEEGNFFDKILKENTATVFFPLIEKYLGIKIADHKTIQEKVQTTLEREMDSLNLIRTEDGDQFILHLEFQTKGDAEMVYRMGEYHGIELRKTQLEIKHFVIYLGKGKSSMKTHLPDRHIYKGFNIINIYDYPTEDLLISNIPEEIVAAILGNFGTTKPEFVVKNIINKLKRICDNDYQLRKYVKQLTVLAKMRNLDKVTKKIFNTMPVYYDITKDSFYLEGLEKGLEKGLEEGLQKENDRIKISIKNMDKKGFDVKTMAEILGITQKRVKAILKEVKSK